LGIDRGGRYRFISGRHRKGGKEKRLSLIVTLAGLVGLSGYQVRATTPQDNGTTAKQDINGAGHDTKNAAKKTGSAVKKGSKKAANAGTKGVKKGAQKTEQGAAKDPRQDSVTHAVQPGVTIRKRKSTADPSVLHAGRGMTTT
jgi:hypothetical protein